MERQVWPTQIRSLSPRRPVTVRGLPGRKQADHDEPREHAGPLAASTPLKRPAGLRRSVRSEEEPHAQDVLGDGGMTIDEAWAERPSGPDGQRPDDDWWVRSPSGSLPRS
ncbi:hypothetical protein GCM10010345_69640 [Streptomyces canarius]|uniref:Uncharacterized protein n=1 Tax=Streptomyces canarius TaxID=285453 RepID=A0ABQ3D2E8_9ACTN|nr:hypothetical protein GCM10010345_69640 [Streptomyces canarius]